jgi:signal transduction histidine kinase
MHFDTDAALEMVTDPRRLAALRQLALLDTTAELAFDRLTRLVTQVLDVPIAMVSLIDDDRQFFKSVVGLPEPWASRRQTPLSHSLCQYSLAGDPLVLEDAREYPTFKDNLAVTEIGVVAYAGVPLITSEGFALGSLCAIDTKARPWSDDDVSILTDLSAAVVTEIELRVIAQVAERQAATVVGLQHVTESLSAVITPSVAAEVVLDQGLRILGADAGVVGLLTEDGNDLRIVAALGHRGDLMKRHRMVPIRAPVPVADAARFGRSRYFESWDAVREYFSGQDLEPYSAFHAGYEAVAAVPLIVDERVLGAFALRFHDKHDFAEEGTDFFETLARQCAQAVDRTQLLEAERLARVQVERLARAKEEFLSDVAHDLQNPLTSIKGFAQILLRQSKRGALDAERVVRSATQIESTALRMEELIQELLDVSAIEEGNPVILRLQSVDLVAVAKRAATLQAGRGTSQVIRVEAEQAEVFGRWDERRIERVIANLLSNAIKYSPDEGRVDIRVGQKLDTDVAVLEVRDTGIGIPESDLPHIFDRFRRGSNVEGTTSGTGLGLAGVKQLVEQHGGTISIQSTVDGGTTVTVMLPCAGPSETDVSLIARPAMPAGGRSRRVLRPNLG